MPTKADVLQAAAEHCGCLGKAADDEPVFVLRAADRCASAAIRDWAHRAKGMGAPPEKVAEAMDVAREFDHWRRANGGGKVPD